MESSDFGETNISGISETERIAGTREQEVARLLGELVDCQELIEVTRQRMNTIAGDARTLKVTWKVIGQALGIRGETAYQRFTAQGRESQRQKAKRRRNHDRSDNQ